MNLQKKININYVSPFIQPIKHENLNQISFNNKFNTDVNQHPKFSFNTNKHQSFTKDFKINPYERKISCLSKDSDSHTVDRQFDMKKEKLVHQKNILSGKQISDGYCKIIFLALLIPLFLGILYCVLYFTVGKKNSKPMRIEQSVNSQIQDGRIQNQNQDNLQYIQPNKLTKSQNFSLLKPIFSQFIPVQSLNYVLPENAILPIENNAITSVEQKKVQFQYVLPQTRVQNSEFLTQLPKSAQNKQKQVIVNISKIFQKNQSNSNQKIMELK